MPSLIPLYHRGGVRACGGIAIFLRRAHPSSRPIPHDAVVKVDGTSAQRGELPVCGSCRQPLWRMDDWTAVPDRTLRTDDRDLVVITDALQIEPPRPQTVAA